MFTVEKPLESRIKKTAMGLTTWFVVVLVISVVEIALGSWIGALGIIGAIGFTYTLHQPNAQYKMIGYWLHAILFGTGSLILAILSVVSYVEVEKLISSMKQISSQNENQMDEIKKIQTNQINQNSLSSNGTTSMPSMPTSKPLNSGSLKPTSMLRADNGFADSVNSQMDSTMSAIKTTATIFMILNIIYCIGTFIAIAFYWRHSKAARELKAGSTKNANSYAEMEENRKPRQNRIEKIAEVEYRNENKAGANRTKSPRNKKPRGPRSPRKEIVYPK